MINPTNPKRRKRSSLQRIERKCDAILRQLQNLRGSRETDNTARIDDAIERLHRAARRMRADAAKEAAMLSRMFHLE